MQRLIIIGLGLLLAVTASLQAPVAALAADHPSEAAGDKAGGDHPGGDPHGSGGGKPELPMKWRADLALWSLVTFLVFFFVLRAVAWNPLRTALDGREAGIAKNIVDAEQARLRAEQMLAEHERKLSKVQDEVKEILAEARRDGEVARQNLIADATREAEAMRSRAVSDIDRAKNQALDELFSVMSSRVLAASEHVIGRSLNDADHSRLVDEALAQVSSTKA